MSLVYDALRQQAGDAVAVSPRPGAAGRVWSRASSQGRSVLVLASGALLAAPLYFIGGHHGAQGVAHASPAAVGAALATERLPTVVLGPSAGAGDTATSTATSAMPIEVAHEASPVPASSRGPGGAPAPAVALATSPQNGPDAAIDPAPGPVPMDAAPTVVRTAAAAPQSPEPMKISIEQRPAALPADTVAPVADTIAVQRAIDAIGAAMTTGDSDAAGRALAGLEALLPAQSLTLLRMQAWIAHDRGEMGAAERLYRQIIGRVPDDETAGVNVALLDAQRGDVDDAHQRLKRLSGQHTRSPLVARALAQVDALR